MRRKNVLKFGEDTESHYEAANAALDSGEYILALTHIHTARWLDPFNGDYTMLLGDAYYEMGLFKRALEHEMALLGMTLFLEKPTFDLVYGCVRSLMAMGERAAAMQYLELAVALCDDFSPDMLESYGDDLSTLMAIASNESNLTMTDTDEDDKAAVKLAVRMIKNEDYNEAFEALTSVCVGARSYWSAQAWLMDCLKGMDNRQAIRARAEIMEKENDWGAIAATSRAYTILDDVENSAKINLRLKTYRGNDVEILGRAAQSFAYLGDFESANSFIVKALRHYPYDTDLLMMQAMTLSQMNRSDEAGNVLLTIIAIDPTDTIAMYHNGRLQDGETIAIDPFVLPQEEITSRVELIYGLYDLSPEEIKSAFEHSYNLAILKWVVLNGYLSDDRNFDVLYQFCESPRCEFLYRQAVVSVDTPRKIKELISAVMIYAWSTDLCISVGYYINRIDCRLPPHAKDHDLYTRAWAYVLATLSQCAINYEKTARSLFKRLLQIHYAPECSARQFAAVILGVILLEYKDQVDFMDTSGMFVGLIGDAEELQKVMQEFMPALISSGIMKRPEKE